MGLLAAMFWGATDFLVGVNARALGVKRAVLFGQLLGLLLMSVIIVISINHWEKFISASWRAVGSGVVASLCTVVGALALSKAFAVGQTAVVAPLVTSYGVFTTLLAWLGGDALSAWQVSGILVCFGGVYWPLAVITVLIPSVRPPARSLSGSLCWPPCSTASAFGFRASSLYRR